jgi:hypothetical protein
MFRSLFFLLVIIQSSHAYPIAPVLSVERIESKVALRAFIQDRGARNGYDVDSLLFPLGTEWILQ